MGGPVLIPHVYDGRSKTFFFFSEQSTRQPSGVTRNLERAYRCPKTRHLYRLHQWRRAAESANP